MGTFRLICENCKKERLLDINSIANKGTITIEKIGNYEEGELEKIYLSCSCKNWVEFDRS